MHGSMLQFCSLFGVIKCSCYQRSMPQILSGQQLQSGVDNDRSFKGITCSLWRKVTPVACYRQKGLCSACRSHPACCHQTGLSKIFKMLFPSSLVDLMVLGTVPVQLPCTLLLPTREEREPRQKQASREKPVGFRPATRM